MILCRCRIVAHEGYDFVAYNRRVALDVFRYNGSPAVGFSQDCRGFTLCRLLRYLALCAAVVFWFVIWSFMLIFFRCLLRDFVDLSRWLSIKISGGQCLKWSLFL